MSIQREGRRCHAAGSGVLQNLDSEISALEQMNLGRLRKAWLQQFGSAAPPLRSRGLLLRVLTWGIQVRANGGLDAPSAKRLAQIAKTLERDGAYEPQIRRDLPPGVVLTREWKGVVHSVFVTAEGFRHDGKIYKSLSDLARTITGTRWSGPRFFGLEQRLQRRDKGVSPP